MADNRNFFARAGFAPAIALVLICGAAAAHFAPEAYDGWLRLSAPDHASLVDVQLEKELTAARFSQEIDAALAAGDDELVQSFVDLGAARGFGLSGMQRERLAAMRAQSGPRSVHEFAEGFVHGGVGSAAGMAGALVGDLSGYGDARDLWHEVQRLSRGEEADHVVMGVATAGLALSAAAWSSLGAALPARGGLTLVKSAQKAGKLSRPLVTALSATAAATIDRDALTASFKAASRLDVDAARAAAGKAMRPGAFDAFRAIGADASTLYRRLGARGTTQVFAIAADEKELRAATSLAAARGGRTRAILATLGRGALSVGWVLAAATQVVFYFIAALIGLALAARALGVALARLPSPRFFQRRPKEIMTPRVQTPAD